MNSARETRPSLSVSRRRNSAADTKPSWFESRASKRVAQAGRASEGAATAANAIAAKPATAKRCGPRRRTGGSSSTLMKLRSASLADRPCSRQRSMKACLVAYGRRISSVSLFLGARGAVIGTAKPIQKPLTSAIVSSSSPREALKAEIGQGAPRLTASPHQRRDGTSASWSQAGVCSWRFVELPPAMPPKLVEPSALLRLAVDTRSDRQRCGRCYRSSGWHP